MGRRGPAKKPTKLRKAEGVRGHRPLNEREPKFKEDKSPPPPEHLSAYAKREWRRLAPALFSQGLLTVGDRHAYAVYCELVSRFRDICREKVSGEQRPAWERRLRDTGLAVIRACAQFGLTPSARADIVAEKVEQGLDAFVGELKVHKAG